jgi:hypothetical protein
LGISETLKTTPILRNLLQNVKNRLDYIDGDLIANKAIEQIILNGQLRSYGLKLLFKKKKGRFNGWISYTISKSEQRTPGRTPTESRDK